VKFVVMMAIQGTIALKPKKKQHMSTMGVEDTNRRYPQPTLMLRGLANPGFKPTL
jgi:hypothetical protein